MWWKPSTNFVARHCTFFTIVIYFFNCGVHITCLYWRCGLTKAVNNFFKRGSSRYEKGSTNQPSYCVCFLHFHRNVFIKFYRYIEDNSKIFLFKNMFQLLLMNRVPLSVDNIIKFSQGQDMTFSVWKVSIHFWDNCFNEFMIVAEVRLLWLLFVEKC